MKRTLKRLGQIISLTLTSPAGFACWVEQKGNRKAERVFGFFSQLFALVPGLPGVYLRIAFYRWTLDACSLESAIGFGSVVSHRTTEIGPNVYIGSYALIGSSRIGVACLIGSRVSLLSGGWLHTRDLHGMWTPTEHSKMQQIVIGDHVWIGEGAVVMADVGAGAMVAAGSVVSSDVKPDVIVGGNPARFVRTLSTVDQKNANTQTNAV